MTFTIHKAAPPPSKPVAAPINTGPYWGNTAPTTIIDERYECTSGGSNKYWEILIVDNGVKGSGYQYHAEVKYGKMDTRGMSQEKDFSSAKACNAWAQSKIQEKLDKGYVKVGMGSQVLVNSMLPPKPLTATTINGIKAHLKQAAQDLCNKLAVGVQKECIVTMIVGGEVIQETIKV